MIITENAEATLVVPSLQFILEELTLESLGSGIDNTGRAIANFVREVARRIREMIGKILQSARSFFSALNGKLRELRGADKAVASAASEDRAMLLERIRTGIPGYGAPIEMLTGIGLSGIEAVEEAAEVISDLKNQLVRSAKSVLSGMSSAAQEAKYMLMPSKGTKSSRAAAVLFAGATATRYAKAAEQLSRSKAEFDKQVSDICEEAAKAAGDGSDTSLAQRARDAQSVVMTSYRNANRFVAKYMVPLGAVLGVAVAVYATKQTAGSRGSSDSGIDDLTVPEQTPIVNPTSQVLDKVRAIPSPLGGRPGSTPYALDSLAGPNPPSVLYDPDVAEPRAAPQNDNSLLLPTMQF